MITIIEASENSAIINVPIEQLKKMGLEIGDEVELSKENGEIFLRSKTEAERKRKFEAAKDKVFEEWHDVFVELAKGADDSVETKTANKRFNLLQTTDGKYRFNLIAANGQVVFESASYDLEKDAIAAIDSLKKLLSETKDKI